MLPFDPNGRGVWRVSKVNICCHGRRGPGQPQPRTVRLEQHVRCETFQSRTEIPANVGTYVS
eukprot:7380122-Prymnesium_polylepis.1